MSEYSDKARLQKLADAGDQSAQAYLDRLNIRQGGEGIRERMQHVIEAHLPVVVRLNHTHDARLLCMKGPEHNSDNAWFINLGLAIVERDASILQIHGFELVLSQPDHDPLLDRIDTYLGVLSQQLTTEHIRNHVAREWSWWAPLPPQEILHTNVALTRADIMLAMEASNQDVLERVRALLNAHPRLNASMMDHLRKGLCWYTDVDPLDYDWTGTIDEHVEAWAREERPELFAAAGEDTFRFRDPACRALSWEHDDTTTSPCSKLFGFPDLPPALEWPLNHGGLPLDFLAQISMRELIAALDDDADGDMTRSTHTWRDMLACSDAISEETWFYFFYARSYSTFSPERIATQNGPESRGDWRVLMARVEHEDQLERRMAPKPIMSWLGGGSRWALPAQPLRAATRSARWAWDCEATLDALAAVDRHTLGALEQIFLNPQPCSNNFEGDPIGPHLIMGHPPRACLSHTPPPASNSDDARERSDDWWLLASFVIDVADRTERLCYWVPRHDLERGDVSRVWLSAEPHPLPQNEPREHLPNLHVTAVERAPLPQRKKAHPPSIDPAMIVLPEISAARAIGYELDHDAPTRNAFALEELESIRELGWVSSYCHPVGGWTPLESLAGIEHCTHLESLFMGHNPIEDLSPLAALTNITYLSLSDTFVRDLSPLARLHKLNHLSIDGTLACDLGPLKGLGNLQHISLAEGPPINMDILLELPSLTKVTCYHTQIGDEHAEILLALRERGVEIQAARETEAAINALAAARKGPDPTADALAAMDLKRVSDYWILHGVDEGPKGTVIEFFLNTLDDIDDATAAQALLYRIDAGAPITTSPQQGDRLLCKIIEQNAGEEVLETFLILAPPTNPPAPDIKGWDRQGNPEYPRWPKSVLETAIKRHSDHLDLLISAGASLAHPSVLSAAAYRGDEALVERALAAGADPDGVWDGDHPLSEALYFNHLAIARRLLDAGSDPNFWVPSIIPHRPVHKARSAQALALLEQHGADLAARNAHGNTALHEAVDKLPRMGGPPKSFKPFVKALLKYIPANDAFQRQTLLRHFVSAIEGSYESLQPTIAQLCDQVRRAGADPLLPTPVVRGHFMSAGVASPALLREIADTYQDAYAAIGQLMGDASDVEINTRRWRAMGALLLRDDLLNDATRAAITQRLRTLLQARNTESAHVLLSWSCEDKKHPNLLAYALLNGTCDATGGSMWQIASRDPALCSALLDANAPTHHVEPLGDTTHHIFADARSLTLGHLLRLGPPPPTRRPGRPVSFAVAHRAMRDEEFLAYFDHYPLQEGDDAARDVLASKDTSAGL